MRPAANKNNQVTKEEFTDSEWESMKKIFDIMHRIKQQNRSKGRA